jgi:uroporphyrinogen decarboxylase
VHYRFDGLAEWCGKNRARYTLVWVGDLWERATFMRGMQDLLLDLALHPAFVEALLDRLANHILETMKILFERPDLSGFDGIAVSDDYGTQKAMLMSPEHWRRFVRPRLARIYALAKKHHRTVFHHTCGNVTPIIGDFIEMGLDILHPIQPEAMDILKLKREFGKDLTFCGGVRTQDLLPFGSPEEVRDEVRRLKREMGKGGGYILEPGITLQADVPLENLVALIDEARTE